MITNKSVHTQRSHRTSLSLCFGTGVQKQTDNPQTREVTQEKISTDGCTTRLCDNAGEENGVRQGDWLSREKNEQDR